MQLVLRQKIAAAAASEVFLSSGEISGEWGKHSAVDTQNYTGVNRSKTTGEKKETEGKGDLKKGEKAYYMFSILHLVLPTNGDIKTPFYKLDIVLPALFN